MTETPEKTEEKTQQPSKGKEIRSFMYAEGPSVEADLICMVCHEPLLEPVIEVACGQMFCSQCLHDWLQREATCPHCRQPLDITKISPPPRFVKNKLDSLLVVCPVCRQNFERSLLAGHIASCPQDCELGCKEKVAPKDHDAHDTICPMKIVPCLAADVGCAYQCAREGLSYHTGVCPVLPLAPILRSLQMRVHVLEARVDKQEKKTARRQAKKEAKQAALDSINAPVPTRRAKPTKKKGSKCGKKITPQSKSGSSRGEVQTCKGCGGIGLALVTENGYCNHCNQ